MKTFTLGIVVGLLLGAVVFYTHTVHAQSGAAAYVQAVRDMNGGVNQFKGSEIVGFSCSGDYPRVACFVATTK